VFSNTNTRARARNSLKNFMFSSILIYFKENKSFPVIKIGG
jgi:hypothetical protein